MSRMQAPVLLVGSLPFDTVDEALRVGGEAIGASVPCLPDGEVGSRKNWAGFLATDVFPAHPDLELAHRPAGELTQPDREREESFEEDVRRDENATLRFRVKPGVRELRFDDLGYGRIAQDSYRVFRRLRDAGTIAPEVRFQVCLPAADSAIDAFFDDVRRWPPVHDAYAAALRREIARMLETIPAGDPGDPVRRGLGGRGPGDGRREVRPVLAGRDVRREAGAARGLAVRALARDPGRDAARVPPVLRDVGRLADDGDARPRAVRPAVQ